MLEPEEVGQMVSVFVTTPDSKGDILSVVLRKQSSQASCRLQLVLTSFPIPQPAILYGRSKWLRQF
jgi:hypothetical protein